MAAHLPAAVQLRWLSTMCQSTPHSVSTLPPRLTSQNSPPPLSFPPPPPPCRVDVDSAGSAIICCSSTFVHIKARSCFRRPRQAKVFKCNMFLNVCCICTLCTTDQQFVAGHAHFWHSLQSNVAAMTSATQAFLSTRVPR